MNGDLITRVKDGPFLDKPKKTKEASADGKDGKAEAPAAAF